MTTMQEMEAQIRALRAAFGSLAEVLHKEAPKIGEALIARLQKESYSFDASDFPLEAEYLRLLANPSLPQ